MYLRSCIYGTLSRIVCCPRLGTIPGPQLLSEVQRGPLKPIHPAYRGISLRLSHELAAPAAAGEGEEHRKHVKTVAAFRPTQFNEPYITPGFEFLSVDQAQHDLGPESREVWERERFDDLISSLLSTNPTSQAKAKRSQSIRYGIHTEDKRFVNKLLKDKGLSSCNWRVAMSVLLRYPTTTSIDRPQDRKLVRNLTSRTRKSFRLARSISPPAEWSEANLTAYVEALAESQKTQTLFPCAQRPLLQGRANIGDVVDAFDNVFYGTASQKFLSLGACNTALRFFQDHAMMTKARDLYVRMEDLKMRIPTETYNILLRGPASQKDMHNFTFLLNNLIRRGFKPNEETWTLFLQVIDSSGVRAVVAQKMAELNMLDKIGIRRSVATQMIPYEMVNHLDNGHDHHSFLNHMTRKYGVDWLTTGGGNSLLNEVAKRKSTVDSLSLLHEMKQAGFIANDISMNTLLRRCFPLRQHNLAIAIVKVFKMLFRLDPGPQAYETLFLQAWRCRCLNLSAVIWRAACVSGAASRRIRHRVFQSLLSHASEQHKPIKSGEPEESSKLGPAAIFKKFAGRFIIGLDGVREAAFDTRELDSRHKTFEWAKALLRNSLRISSTSLLEGDLSELLQQARLMDKTWAAEGLFKKDDWRDMFPRAIALRVSVNGRLLRRRPSRFRKNLDQGNSIAGLLPQKGSLPEGANSQNVIRLRPDVQIRKKLRRTQSPREADLLWRSRKGVRRVRSKPRLSTLQRRASAQQSPGPPSRRLSKTESPDSKGAASTSPPQRLARYRNEDRPTLLGDPAHV